MVEPKTKLQRLPKRQVEDTEEINAILDKAPLCHVGFVDDSIPYVIPTIFARVEDKIYLHGSMASRMLNVLNQGGWACVTITHLDGLVLARSAFHHSMNYRSVLIFGKGAEVTDPSEHLMALELITEKLVPGRWQDARQPNEKELRATKVVRISMDKVSAKVRVGPPVDDEEDYQLPVWAGVLPLGLRASALVPDDRLDPNTSIPDYLKGLFRD